MTESARADAPSRGGHRRYGHPGRGVHRRRRGAGRRRRAGREPQQRRPRGLGAADPHGRRAVPARRSGPDAAGRVVAAVIGLAGGARADESFLTAVRPAGRAGPTPPGLRSRRGLLLGHPGTRGLRPGGRHRCGGRAHRRRRAPGAPRRLGLAAGRRGIRLLARPRGGPGDPDPAADRHRAARLRWPRPSSGCRDPRPGGDRPALLREPPGLAVDLRRAGDSPRRRPGGGGDRRPSRRAPGRHPARIWTSMPTSRWCWRVRWPPVRARSARRCGRVSTSG